MTVEVINITFDWLKHHGYESVTDYCRDLVKTGDYNKKIAVWRGDMLCLTVTDVYAASKLVPNPEGGWSKYIDSKGPRRLTGALK